MSLVIATAALVFLRAIQQQNVIHGHYVMAAVTPFGIAAAEVAMVLFVVDTGWSSIPYVGTGGAIGVVAGMAAHRRIFNRA